MPTSFVLPYRWVSIILGVILLTSAILKWYAPSTVPMVLDGIIPIAKAKWERITLISIELFMGIWLLGGWHKRQARSAAVVVFMVFAAFALNTTLDGEPTCGCFGAVGMPPYFAAVIDYVAIGALLRWAPHGQPGILHRPVTWVVALMAPAALSIMPFTVESNVAITSRIAVAPKAIHFGELTSGETRTSLLILTNTSNHPLLVSRIIASCPCVTLDPTSILVQAGSSEPIEVKFDTSIEPNFEGKLRVQIEGIDDKGIDSFHSEAYIKVVGKPRPQFQTQSLSLERH